MQEIDWKIVFNLLDHVAKGGEISTLSKITIDKNNSVIADKLGEWLIDEGFIKHNSQGATLTSMGFDLYQILKNEDLWQKFACEVSAKHLPLTLTFIKTAIPIFYKKVAEKYIDCE